MLSTKMNNHFRLASFEYQSKSCTVCLECSNWSKNGNYTRQRGGEGQSRFHIQNRTMFVQEVTFFPFATPFTEASEIALSELEQVFLRDDPCIFSTEPSLADLSCFEEIKQMDMLIPEYDWTKHPHIRAWRERMSKLPHFQEVHAVLHKVVESGKRKQAQL